MGTTAAVTIAALQLAAQLSPAAIQLVNGIIASFQNSGLSEADQLKALNDLAASLKPMELKA